MGIGAACSPPGPPEACDGLLEAVCDPSRFDEPTPETVQTRKEISRRLGAELGITRLLQELQRTSLALDEERDGREGVIALGELASGLAHELKNPLASMSLAVSILRRATEGNTELQPLADKACSLVLELGRRMNAVGEKICRPRVDFRPVQISVVVREAVRYIAPRAQAGSVSLHLELDAGLPPVSGDALLLKHACIHLLLNALEAMPAAGTLRARSRLAKGKRAEVVITDSGPGIDPDCAERLFRPLESSKPGRSGMGLSIVRRIAELHSGHVTLARDSDGGTRAIISLPLSEARTP